MGLREAISENAPFWLATGGLIIGFVLGFIVFRTNFCTMGAISDILSFGDYRRFRAWLLAATTALIGTQALQAAGVVDLSRSIYVGASFNWVGHILGGLMFGYGMVFAGGCASRNLARAGAGDLRSLLTLIIMGLFAYMAIGGVFGPIRDALERATALGLGRFGAKTQDLGSLAALAMPASAATLGLLATAIVAGIALVYCLADRDFRTSGAHVTSGLAIGLCVVAGWALTGLAFDELSDRPVAPLSLTFVRPTADTMEWLQRFTAGMVPAFGVAGVLGTLLGSFVAARMTGRFRLASFTDVADTKRNLFGAALMGVGGIMALGCTVGQAITGISTLALGSFLTFAAIVLGCYAGMKHLERTLMAEA